MTSVLPNDEAEQSARDKAVTPLLSVFRRHSNGNTIITGCSPIGSSALVRGLSFSQHHIQLLTCNITRKIRCEYMQSVHVRLSSLWIGVPRNVPNNIARVILPLRQPLMNFHGHFPGAIEMRVPS